METDEQKELHEKQVKERKEFFEKFRKNLSKITLPTEPVKLNEAETVMNCKNFVETHLSFIESHIEKDICIPYLQRLIKFAEII